LNASSPPYLATIVGLGRIAWKLEKDSLREKPATHVGALLQEPRFVLGGGIDADFEARRQFHEEFHIPTFETFEQMLKKMSPQLFIIATHPDSHFYYLSRAIEARIPLILCEKPLGLLHQDFSPLLKKAEKRGIRVMMNHERRYSLDWRHAQELLNQGMLGNPLNFYARISMGKSRDPASVLFWDGTHMIDALRFLFPGSWSLKKTWRTHHPNQVMGATLQVGSLSGIISVSNGFDHLVFELEVQCEKGRLRIGNGTWEVWESQKSPFYEGFRSLVKHEEKIWSTTNYFRGVYQDAADCLQNPTKQPESTGWDGWEALKIIRSIQRSYWFK